MLTNFQIAYVTDATDVSLGGTGIDLQLKIYENFAPCGLLESTDAPIATVDLLDLPASTTGTLAGVLLDVDLSGLNVCLRADGDDDYSDGTSDLFGWSLEYIDNGDGANGGPFLSGDPAVFGFGDGTFFQAPLDNGTGLGTEDLWREIELDGSSNCFSLGGYVPGMTPFSSFFAVISGDVFNECIGCGVGDDRFEANDTQMDAAPVELDSYGSLISDVGDDFFQVTVPAGTALRADILFDTSISDLDLILLDAGGATLGTGFSTTDNETAIAENCDSMNPVDVFVRVNNFGGFCNEYDLVLSLDPLFDDDAFEDNDICTSAVVGPLGTTRDLIVRPCGSEEDSSADDDDFFLYTLPAGEAITVDILFTDAVADLDGVLLDVTAGCPGVVVDTGFTSTDNEQLQFMNSTAAPLTMAVRVNHFSGDSALYDLNVKIGEASISEVICLGTPNSVGDGARVCTTGSDVAADDDITFEVSALPPNTVGYFVVSQDVFVIVNPGGSSGTLCIASVNLGRYVGDILSTGATGAVSFSPSVTSIPLSGVGPAMAGDSFNFQCWYRDTDDMGMPTSDFTDAVSIEFN